MGTYQVVTGISSIIFLNVFDSMSEKAQLHNNKIVYDFMISRKIYIF